MIFQNDSLQFLHLIPQLLKQSFLQHQHVEHVHFKIVGTKQTYY